MTKGRWILVVLAMIGVGLSVLNASWFAPDPEGRVKLIANRGIHPQFDRAAAEKDCSARYIDPVRFTFIGNTLAAMRGAAGVGADAVKVDVTPSGDGNMMLFEDATLDCRTDGTGKVRDKTLARLKTLDVGYGYTPDEGKSHPLRGEGTGLMPTVEEALRAKINRELIFSFASDDPGQADLLAAAFRRAGAKLDGKYGFVGPPAPVDRVESIAPDAWAFSPSRAMQCTGDYGLYGWTGIVPDSCKGGTMLIPLGSQWRMWGWPNRLIARMEKADTRIVIVGSYDGDEALTGLTEPDQLGRIPADYNGYVLVEDIWWIGRSLGRLNRKLE